MRVRRELVRGDVRNAAESAAEPAAVATAEPAAAAVRIVREISGFCWNCAHVRTP